MDNRFFLVLPCSAILGSWGVGNEVRWRASDNGAMNRGVVSFAGDKAGEAEGFCIGNRRAFAMFSRSAVDRADFLPLARPAVPDGAEVRPLTPFSLVTSPLS